MTAAIRDAETSEDLRFARVLFVEYAQWLNVDLCFQDFDRELATLPGAYARPRGRLLLAGEPADAFGCIALRPLGEDATGEVKRLFVQPRARKEGWGSRLVEKVLSEARRDRLRGAEARHARLDGRRARAVCEARVSRMRAVLRQSVAGRGVHGARVMKRPRQARALIENRLSPSGVFPSTARAGSPTVTSR